MKGEEQRQLHNVVSFLIIMVVMILVYAVASGAAAGFVEPIISNIRLIFPTIN